MASPSQSSISVGECVCCDGRVWLVSATQNRFGWNQFHLVDLDSGVSAVMRRFQLETLPESAEDRSTESTVNQKWRYHSDADLTHLQEMRHAKSTSQQTRWAVGAVVVSGCRIAAKTVLLFAEVTMVTDA